MNKQRFYLFIPLIVFLVLGIFFYIGLSRDPNEMPSALLNKPIPAFKLPRLENSEEVRDESLFKGQVTLLNVWATWCVTCKEEHAFLNQLKEQGIRIIGLDYKDEPEKALRWIGTLGNPYEDILVDEEGRMGIDLGVFGAPETYVIDKNGFIRYKHIGDLNLTVWDTKIKSIVLDLQKQ